MGLPEKMTLSEAIEFKVLDVQQDTLRKRMHRDRSAGRFVPQSVGYDRTKTAKMYLTADLQAWNAAWTNPAVSGKDGRPRTGLPQHVRRGSREIIAFLDYLALFGVHLARLDGKTSQVAVLTSDERAHLVTAWRVKRPERSQQTFDLFAEPEDHVDSLAMLLGKMKEAGDDVPDQD